MGGGGSKTTSNIEIVNNSIIDAVISSAQNCSSSTVANQNIVRSGFGFWNTSSQTVNISLSCLQKVIVNNDLIAKMTQNIIQNVQANNGSLFGGPADSTANQKIQNYLKTKVSTEFVQNCVAAAIANQNVLYSGVQIGVSDYQTLQSIQKCVSNALNNNSVAQGITSDVKTSANASVTGFGFDLGLGNLFGGSSMWLLLLVLLIIVAIWYKYYRADPSDQYALQPVQQ
jgi:hypothetical protein